MSQQQQICVVGAGIIGLSTAVALQTSGLNVDVTIVADKFSPETTSDVAAGIWTPHALSDTPAALIRRWGEATFQHLEQLFMREDCSETGVTQVSGYRLYSDRGNDLNPFWKDVVRNFKVLTPVDLKQFPGAKEGYFYTTFLCEPTIHLKWLLTQFKKNNGRLVKRKLSTLEEVAEDCDLIVNCSGSGARDLVGDQLLDTLRGQVFKLKAPWVKCFYVLDMASYLLPGVSGVVLGGTFQHSRWDTVPNDTDSQSIWSNGCKFMPSIKNAEVLGSLAGLRPLRTTVRLERGEDIHWRGNVTPVVHNYGHGGCGMSLFLGCAQDTVKVVSEMLSNKSKL